MHVANTMDTETERLETPPPPLVMCRQVRTPRISMCGALGPRREFGKRRRSDVASSGGAGGGGRIARQGYARLLAPSNIAINDSRSNLYTRLEFCVPVSDNRSVLCLVIILFRRLHNTTHGLVLLLAPSSSTFTLPPGG